MDLCGHATLASAAALALECGNAARCFDFDTRSGMLTATRHGTTNAFELDLPSNPPSPSETEAHHVIAEAVVTSEHAAAIQRLAYSATTKKLVVQMDHDAGFDRAALQALQVPAPDSLLAIPQDVSCPVTGVMVTVWSREPQYHFYSRYFAPWNGIPEDPGSCPHPSLSLLRARSPHTPRSDNEIADDFLDLFAWVRWWQQQQQTQFPY